MIKKILFVCHGNICRSPMAEFVFKNMVSERSLDFSDGTSFVIESAATSAEEIGNDMHSGAKEKLREKGIPFTRHRSRRITAADYDKFDVLVGMDIENIYRMEKLWNNDPLDKVKFLLSFAGKDRDIADPWYTHDFEKTFLDINEGCAALLEKILKES